MANASPNRRYSGPAPKWRNWQTRRTQNPVRETSCGFESHLRHLEPSRSTKPRRGGSYSQRLPQSEDTQLLAEIESLYRDRFADFVAVAASIVGEREAARDAVQDAFASVVRARGGFRRSGPLEAWVWRVVINAARKRKERSARDMPMEIAHSSTNGTAPEPKGTSELAALVAALPERQRLMLFLRHYADLDYREIARILGVTTGTVSAGLHAAHATLRRSLIEVRT